MDRHQLACLDEKLDSSEVAALCFLCCDVVNRKRLQGIKDAKGLFLRLEERHLLGNNAFLLQLLRTIRRADLLHHLETDSRPLEDTDASPILSNYRVMLYKIYEDLTKENLGKLKYLMGNKLPRRQMDMSETALDVFIEMEKAGLMSDRNVDELHGALQVMDEQLASIVQNYRDTFLRHFHPPVRVDDQRNNSSSQSQLSSLSIAETLPSCEGETVYSDAQPSLPNSQQTQPRITNPQQPKPSKTTLQTTDETEFYALFRNPRGLCVIFINEEFSGPELKNRVGTNEDQKALSSLFTSFGFKVVVHNNLTAKAILREIENLGARNFLNDDTLVVCVLSHGEEGCIFGSDEQEVMLRDITRPFTSIRAPTLAGKPKVFFIQACQGRGYRKGSLPCPLEQEQEKGIKHFPLEEDADRVCVETVPSDADFLLGMATVPECKSFRNTSTGSIYIQELCRQLKKSAERLSMSFKDIITRNKTDIITTLSGDYRLILNKVHEKELITLREYNNLKDINKETVEGHVIELVDKILNKNDDDICKKFLNLLQTDNDIKGAFPYLGKLPLGRHLPLSPPVQASSSHSDVKPPENRIKKEGGKDYQNPPRCEQRHRQGDV